MKVLCLGGAGQICREAVLDLIENTDFRRITIADVDESAGRELAEAIHHPNVDFVRADVRNTEGTVRVMRDYDIVMDGTTIHLNGQWTACIAAAGCHGINLNGFGEEYKYDQQFATGGKSHVPGFGMTPGVTDMMVKYAADQMDTVEVVRVSHGAFRPIAFSPAITETTLFEYDPELPGRIVFENGRFIQVPPFARERLIPLPHPYGTLPQWIIPHAETRTAHAYLKSKGIRLIEVRGTWPSQNMRLIRALYEYGFFRNEPVPIGDRSVGIMDAVGAYLQQAPEGQTTDLYGYALHVQVIGTCSGTPVEHVLTHSHPPSDGSVAGWEALRSYTRCVGIPLAIGTCLIACGKVGGTGVLMPEFAFEPRDVFAELQKRGIRIQKDIYSPPRQDAESAQ